MATRNGKKNDAIFLVILVLLVLFFGWLAWKLVTVPAAQPRQTAAQTNNYPPISTATSPVANATATPLASDFSRMPTVTFTMPVSSTTATTTPAAQTQPQTQATPAQTTHPSPTPRTRPPPKRHPTPQTQRTASTHPIRPNPADYVPPPDEGSTTSTSNATTTVAPTPFPAADTGPRPGSRLEGFAIIVAKQQDPTTGRFLIAAVTDKSNLTYIYEVDAATFAEAAPSLMFNPARVATWTFVSSQ